MDGVAIRGLFQEAIKRMVDLIIIVLASHISCWFGYLIR